MSSRLLKPPARTVPKPCPHHQTRSCPQHHGPKLMSPEKRQGRHGEHLGQLLSRPKRGEKSLRRCLTQDLLAPVNISRSSVHQIQHLHPKHLLCCVLTGYRALRQQLQGAYELTACNPLRGGMGIRSFNTALKIMASGGPRVAQWVKRLTSARSSSPGSWNRAPHQVPHSVRSLLLPLPLLVR